MGSITTVPERVTSLPLRGLRVEVVSGPDQGQRRLAEGETLSVGTADGNDLILTDERVSRYHLELKRSGDRILVVDHGSTNGTHVGGVAIERALVTAGTVLEVGRSSLVVDDGELVRVSLYDEDSLAGVIGRSAPMRALMAKIRKAAKANVSVLLLGESGTGKEVVARAIHDLGPRADRPFETVDCAALLPALVASELFGHEKGAFTGADRQHIGAFERANGGTVFLDEVGELAPPLQASLLGVLERRRFRRLGGSKEIQVDVRVIAATHRDLRSAVNSGAFRQDLYFRLVVLLLTLPPLRERVEDIPILAQHFLEEAGYDAPLDDILPDNALDALQKHHWPGNVRELRNLVEATVAMGEIPELSGIEGASASAESFPSLSVEALLQMKYKDARSLILREFEVLFVQRLLERYDGNISKAARASEINRNHLAQIARRNKLID